MMGPAAAISIPQSIVAASGVESSHEIKIIGVALIIRQAARLRLK
jgi:antitoxin component of MazEF toxin-antitoxin module